MVKYVEEGDYMDYMEDDEDMDEEDENYLESLMKPGKERHLVSHFEEYFYGCDLWKQFNQVYDEKYSGLKDSGLTAGFGHPYVRNFDANLPLTWYKFYFGLKISEKSVSSDGKSIDLKLPKRFNEIARDFLAFNIKYGKSCIFSNGEKVKSALIPDEEAAKLIKQSGIEISDKIEIHKTCRVS